MVFCGKTANLVSKGVERQLVVVTTKTTQNLLLSPEVVVSGTGSGGGLQPMPSSDGLCSPLSVFL